MRKNIPADAWRTLEYRVRLERREVAPRGRQRCRACAGPVYPSCISRGEPGPFWHTPTSLDPPDHDRLRQHLAPRAHARVGLLAGTRVTTSLAVPARSRDCGTGPGCAACGAAGRRVGLGIGGLVGRVASRLGHACYRGLSMCRTPVRKGARLCLHCKEPLALTSCLREDLRRRGNAPKPPPRRRDAGLDEECAIPHDDLTVDVDRHVAHHHVEVGIGRPW